MGNDGNDAKKEAEKLGLNPSEPQPVEAPGLDKSDQSQQQDISVERRDQRIIGACVALMAITFICQTFVFSIPDVSDHAVFLGIIFVGYAAGFLRGKRANFWGLVFLGINLLFWSASACRVYQTLHPS